MAGLWIPFDKSLPTKPEVLRIAAETGMEAHEVWPILLEFWAWADDHSEDGTLPGMSVRNLSAICPRACGQFWDALVRVGWLVVMEGSMAIPHFSDWLGNSAKRRAKDARRKRQARQGPTPMSAKCPPDKRTRSGQNADRMRTTAQHSTAQDKTPFPPLLDTPEFRTAWEQWQQHRREIRHPLKPTTVRAQLAKLAAWGPAGAVASIEASIAGGYQGLFEPKGKAAAKDLRSLFEEELCQAGLTGPPTTPGSSPSPATPPAGP